MKKYGKIIHVLTIACLLTTTLNGCGDEKMKETESVSTQEETLLIDGNEEETSDEKESGGDVLVEIPNEVDAMRPVLKGLCKVMSRGRIYNPEDANFYWDALYSSINGSTWVHPDIRMSDTGAGYLVPPYVMEEYASAMFAEVHGLTDLPENMGSIEYVEEEEAYLIYSAGGLSGSMDIMAVEKTEDYYKVFVAFHTKKDTVQNYTFELQETQDESMTSFPCQVYNAE